MSTYTPIARQTLGSAAASVTFSSIPQGYTDLVLVMNLGAATSDYVQIVLNSDTANTLYSGTYLLGNGSSASSGARPPSVSERNWPGFCNQTPPPSDRELHGAGD